MKVTQETGEYKVELYAPYGKKNIYRKSVYQDLKDKIILYVIFNFIFVYKKTPITKENKYDQPGWSIGLKMADENAIKLFYKRMIYRDDKTEYLYRINLFECNWFSIKIHKIIASDDKCQHDHPWGFLSFILSEGYIEYTPTGKRRYRVGDILWRPARYVHSLEVGTKPAITFVITFKRVRKWGFYTKSGWIHWKKYSQKEHC